MSHDTEHVHGKNLHLINVLVEKHIQLQKKIVA